MPDKAIYTEVEGQRLKLTNTQKIIYPELELTKAEVIQYYLQVAPYLLQHIKNRPLTLIRYPDGAQGKQFYSKNKPKWSPKWIYSTLVGDDKDNQYVVANSLASIVWLANLVALEIHPMNMRMPNLQFPDQFIFDLDPSEEFDFEELKTIAKSLKQKLEDYGYIPFIKTSGGKGFHIYCAIKPIYTADAVYKAVESIAKEFVKENKESTTLNLSKVKRKGKVLIDIYRNRSTNSCVAPYSLRGKEGAPVSMPIEWSEVDGLKSAQEFNIKTALEQLNKHGDVWANIWETATTLHTQSSADNSQLTEYNKKRDFTKTAEPIAEVPNDAKGNRYVVQLHDASNLHYDLRLEQNGVLLSWALPKGLPHKVGVKRLAVQTEAHPLKYLNFQGTIPKGEYGGGTMWVFATGQYEIIQQEVKKIHFKLLDGDLAGEFVLYNTKKDQWILERKGETDFSIEEYKQPMLAEAIKEYPANAENYFYEIKWDGIRAIIVIENGSHTIYSRNGNDITQQFPELAIISEHIEAQIAVIDCELVHLDSKGRPKFAKLVGRIHNVGERAIEHASKKVPATAYLFDLLYLDGKDCRQNTNIERRMWLNAILSSGERIRFSEAFDDGQALFTAIGAQGMEGIMCKLKTGKYSNGRRSSNWLKWKISNEDTALVIGYTKGEGDRSELLGALHLAKREDGELVYYGKVGTGFTHQKLKQIDKKVKAVPEIKKPVNASIEDERATTWIEPKYECDIQFASFSANNTYREPVFKQMRLAK